MENKHTPTPWRTGIPGTVVADSSDGITIGGATGQENVDYYGGNLIGESISKANAEHIVKCVNAYSEMLEALVLINKFAQCSDDRFANYSDTINELTKKAIKKATE